MHASYWWTVFCSRTFSVWKEPAYMSFIISVFLSFSASFLQWPKETGKYQWGRLTMIELGLCPRDRLLVMSYWKAVRVHLNRITSINVTHRRRPALTMAVSTCIVTPVRPQIQCLGLHRDQGPIQGQGQGCNQDAIAKSRLLTYSTQCPWNMDRICKLEYCHCPFCSSAI